MPTIVLARHGKLAWNPWRPVAGRDLAEWRQQGASAPLDPASRTGGALRRLAEASPMLIASSLRRSLDSAAVLLPPKTPEVEPLVREVESPSAFRTKLRLPGTLWGLLARLGWYAGWSPGVESYRAARERAERAAARLAELAGQQGQLVVIAHGIMNGLIGKELRRSGWRGPWFRTRRHWAFASYRR